jgi:hypothetical protein
MEKPRSNKVFKFSIQRQYRGPVPHQEFIRPIDAAVSVTVSYTDDARDLVDQFWGNSKLLDEMDEDFASGDKEFSPDGDGGSDADIERLLRKDVQRIIHCAEEKFGLGSVVKFALDVESIDIIGAEKIVEDSLLEVMANAESEARKNAGSHALPWIAFVIVGLMIAGFVSIVISRDGDAIGGREAGGAPAETPPATPSAQTPSSYSGGACQASAQARLESCLYGPESTWGHCRTDYLDALDRC